MWSCWSRCDLVEGTLSLQGWALRSTCSRYAQCGHRLLLLSIDQDIEFLAPSPPACLSAHCHAHYDNNGLNLWNCKPSQLHAFLCRSFLLWCLFTAIDTFTKTGVATRNWGNAVIALFLFGGIWILVLLIRKAAEFFEHCLMSHTRRSMNDLNFGGLAQEDFEKKNFSMLRRDHSCDIWMNYVAAFCPCLKILPEVKVKLTLLTEEISNNLV